MHESISKFTCPDCGAEFTASEPKKCPKCNSFRAVPSTPIFPDVKDALRNCRDRLHETAMLVSRRNHRKSRFIIAQLRRAEEAVEVAAGAVMVANSEGSKARK
jgi:hypothetical protein